MQVTAKQGHTTGATPAPAPTPERILDAAESLFADRGFAGAAMRDIAAAAELNPASLYNHFKSKQALYEAVLERGLRPMFELIESLQPFEWAPERLDEATDALIMHLARQRHLPRLLFREALSGGEHLTGLAQQWLRPLYDRALRTFHESRARGESVLSIWDDAELPLVLMTFHHVVVGNFAVVAMLREVLDEDPLSPESLERQRRFVRKVVRLLIVGSAFPEEREGPARG